MKKPTLNRRSFLKSSAAASAVVAAPTLLLPRFAHATPAFGAADHVLVLWARGGFRSHCTFNAPEAIKHNPFGRHRPVAQAEYRLGLHVPVEPYSSSMGPVPSLVDIAPHAAVLTSVDHAPGQAMVDVDHRTASNRIATGDPEGRTGLLSMVGRHHPAFANGFDGAVMPPVEIGPSEYGLGAGDYASTRPLSVLSAENSFASGESVAAGWHTDLRETMSQRFVSQRSRAFKKRLDNYLVAKLNAVRFAADLTDPTLDVINQPDATAQGLTNAQLLSVLGNYTLDTLGDFEMLPSWGPNVAMALRFFGKGSPMCVVTNAIYDLHDDEADLYIPRSRDLIRQLSGLHFLLNRMEHPEGGTYYDRTMVFVVSEFSRNNTFDETGFNSGNGSDHVADDAGATRNQAVFTMGGPLTKTGRQLGATDENMNAIGPVFSSQALVATMLDVLGINPSAHFADPAIAELFS